MDVPKEKRSAYSDLWQCRHSGCWLENQCRRCKSLPSRFQQCFSQKTNRLIAALLKTHILREYTDCEWVHLYPESHTRNKGYVENLIALKELLEIAGFRCTVGSVDFVELGHLIGLSGALKAGPSRVKIERW